MLVLTLREGWVGPGEQESMSRVAYAGGQYVPHRSASVHLEDHGYQFADGDYEMLAVVGGAGILSTRRRTSSGWRDRVRSCGLLRQCLTPH
jgi:hypothetical protein